MLSIEARIAQELSARTEQVVATVKMLDEGSTVPFIARYRKEATGGLDDTQLRTLEERLRYLREMEERRAAIISSVEEQGKMTPELKSDLLAADSKARLEDLYLPYKQKRRTKGQIAREAGLEPLADALLADPTLVPEQAAAAYVDAEKQVADVKAALDGARSILVERFAEDATLVGQLRDNLWTQGVLKAAVVEGKQESGAKFRDYFEHAEGIAKIPSHRALALFRGRKEEVLTLNLALPEDTTTTPELRIAAHNGIADRGRPGDKWLLDVCRWCWRTKLSIHIEIDLLGRLFDAAEEEAIKVFAGNLRDLLLAAPAGQRATLALDPGFRTGVKVAAIDATGKLVDTAVIYPHEPQRRWDDALMQLASLCRKHKLELISIGNGTASRETEKLAGELSTKYPELGLTRVVVSEAGASIYSASAFAAQEFPDVDVSLRGAVSIGRRLQDPLAELVKIDPKSIGVGQYQHDLSENKLGRTLDAVVEDCVNAVGVDLNTASVPLLTRVSGLSEALARNIVAWRDANGAFKNRNQLKDVSRLGPKAFEQAAGFLRVPNGDDPLDASTVHPEAYPVVRRILKATGKAMADVIGDGVTLRRLNPADFTDDTFGVPTVKDILKELEKPGNDPRPEFRQAKFDDSVQEMKDLKPGMILEGAVTNVTNFGAFVDIGVHQDGLVHISALADKFVKDPREVVKPGQVVKVKVLEVDLPRKRIALTMKMGDQAPAPRQQQVASRSDHKAFKGAVSGSSDGGGGAMAAALARAGLKQR
ncbi:Tex family protein [Lacibacterium aquatile]|uniref:Tex family protein n=1 Tax=Lacibacterium aquatile TaxID=1168082 RepID=A0ABW5DQR4_9PROT